VYDIFFLSHGEPVADRHWDDLKSRFAHAKRVDGVNGILAGHRRCAELATTRHLFVVDADNEIKGGFNFDYRVPTWDANYVHLWYARNPLNRLEYGWGGLKLFPRRALLAKTLMGLDMTMDFSLKIIPEVVSITHFNSSPFEAWRSAFRECVKLSRSTVEESAQRLSIWCSTANGPYAEWCLAGAKKGREFGMAANTEDLRLVNDWDWLRTEYETEFSLYADPH
jgi:hypothetical protein